MVRHGERVHPMWVMILVKVNHLLLTINSATNILLYSYKVSYSFFFCPCFLLMKVNHPPFTINSNILLYSYKVGLQCFSGSFWELLEIFDYSSMLLQSQGTDGYPWEPLHSCSRICIYVELLLMQDFKFRSVVLSAFQSKRQSLEMSMKGSFSARHRSR